MFQKGVGREGKLARGIGRGREGIQGTQVGATKTGDGVAAAGMQLLRVAKQQIAAGELARAQPTRKGFFLGVGPLVAVQVLEASEGAEAEGTDKVAGFAGGGGAIDGGLW